MVGSCTNGIGSAWVLDETRIDTPVVVADLISPAVWIGHAFH